ncbi:hypothetical protein B1R94_03710 [Mycolicibacterium litorale]|nr:hypothetical protein B1R94_03710 [Mycolicibacterium litorale]
MVPRVRPHFVHFTTAELAALAGGDPWQADDELQAGDPGSINDLAEAFHRSSTHVKDADDEFNAAKKTFEESWNRRGGAQHPINDAAEVQRVSAALAAHPEELASIATDLEQAAAALATAQHESAAQIDAMNTQLHGIDGEISAQGPEAPWLIPQLHGQARDATRTGLAHIETIRGAYLDQLHGAETAMMASGYIPDALDRIDGVPGDSPDEAAKRYDQSGQRAKDQALSDRARASKGDGTLGWSRDEQDAAQRLEDYKSITDPARGVAHRGGEAAQAEAKRLAGERLDDFNMANSTGVVARDPVLGGDVRTRAQTRLKLQHDLETGQLPSHPQPLIPDEATKLMDQMELANRANTLVRLQQTLQQCGMSAEGAAQVAEGFAHGVIPDEYLEGASAASKVFDSGNEAMGSYADLLPGGRHWAPGVAFSPDDVEALKTLGRRIGVVGSALDLGVGAYEVFVEGKPLVDVAVETGGGMAGAWAGAEAGGFVLSGFGPPGVFIGVLAGGVGGAFAGERAAGRLLEWVKG